MAEVLAAAASAPQPALQKRTRQAKTASKPRGTSRPIMRPGTKLASLVRLLERTQGVTIKEAARATKWQPHSVRGAISGSIKKKFGLQVTSKEVEGRGRVYRIGGRR